VRIDSLSMAQSQKALGDLETLLVLYLVAAMA